MTMHSDSFGVGRSALAQFFHSLRKRLASAAHQRRRRRRSLHELAAMSNLQLKDLGYPAAADARTLERRG